MSRRLSPRVRFGVWAAGVAAPLAAGGLFLADDPVWDLAAAAAISGSLGLMWWLLETTPPDAIKLRPGTSRLLIGGGWCWLLLVEAGWLAALAGLILSGLWGLVGAVRVAGASDREPRGSPWRAVWLWSPSWVFLLGPLRQFTSRIGEPVGGPVGIDLALALPFALLGGAASIVAFARSGAERLRLLRCSAIVTTVAGSVLCYGLRAVF